MDDERRRSQRRPWTEGPDEEAPPESWLLSTTTSCSTASRPSTPREDEDDRLIEVVDERPSLLHPPGGRQARAGPAPALRVRGRPARRPDPRPPPLAAGGPHVPRAALHAEPPRRGAPGGPGTARARVAEARELPAARDAPRGRGCPFPWSPSGTRRRSPRRRHRPRSGRPRRPSRRRQPARRSRATRWTGASWGGPTHFLVEQVWRHLGTAATRGAPAPDPRRAHAEPHDALDVHGWAGRPRHCSPSSPAPGSPGRPSTTWRPGWLPSAGPPSATAPEAAGHSVRASTALMADALRAAGSTPPATRRRWRSSAEAGRRLTRGAG